jgi:hypothetical protein
MKTGIVDAKDLNPAKSLRASDYLPTGEPLSVEDISDLAFGGMQEIAEQCHRTSRMKGWWEKVDKFIRDFPEIARDFIPEIMSSKLMLTVSELSEALEEIRQPHSEPRSIYYTAEIDGGTMAGPYADVKATMIAAGITNKEPKPEGFPIELADAIIRCFDLAARHGIDIGSAVRIKMKYNEGRPLLHGGKNL